MIDDPMSAEHQGQVRLTMSADDAQVLREFLSCLCTDDFKKNLTYREHLHPRSQQVAGKVYRALRSPAPYPQVGDGS